MRAEVKAFILEQLRDIIYYELKQGNDVSKFQGTFEVLDSSFRAMKKLGDE